MAGLGDGVCPTLSWHKVLGCYYRYLRVYEGEPAMPLSDWFNPYMLLVANLANTK